MADRTPLIRDGATNLASELQPGDTLALVAMNASLQHLVASILTTHSGALLQAHTGDTLNVRV